MGCNCGCGSYTPCGCGSYNPCVPTNCATVCGALTVSNAFNMPACSATATLSVPKLKNLQLNSFLWNSSYGYLQVTSFNAVTGEVVVTNTCVEGNVAPGTIIPAYTSFIVTDSPFDAHLTFGNIDSFIMPTCGNTVVVETNGVPNVVVGSWIWNPTAGYLEVTAYNTSTFDLTLQNNCTAGNAVPGATVVAGSSFILTPPPPANSYNTWTPAVTASGAMTIAALVITEAAYWEVGNLIFFSISLNYTLGGVTNNQVFITLPTEAPGTGAASDGYICAASENGAVVTNGGLWRITTGNPAQIVLTKPAAANWTLGAGAGTDIQGFYQRTF